DVTDARKIIKDYYERTENRISFTGWIIKCISEAIKENKIIHAYRIKRNKIIIPQEVRFGIMVERQTESGQKVPFMAVIDNTEERNVIEISDEIRKIQGEVIEEQDQMMGEQNLVRKLQMILFRIVPNFISRWLIKKIALSKKFVTKFSGTVGVTALGMYGKNVAGWAIHFPTRTVDLALGGIKEKPGFVDSKVIPRDILNMTFNIDHNIVDGAPAARFIAKSVELIESAFGLEVLEK
ncbi:MAG: 2-oxo acid dehydrogenase subunit E2, partial [Asgard group archaeon]|nr:2-oxo acid dehydrogenase subunit E2 [Asgard group archaeon]